jgi:4-hydroxy-3-polyprenylbenzoate decarboxylase
VRDLRDWIARLERDGELARVGARVDPRLEITEVADRMAKSGGPALLFTDVEGSDMPVLINQFGTERRMCAALGTDSLDALGSRIESLMDLQPPQGVVAKVRALGRQRELASFSSKTVREGPCQEIWLDEPDLDRLPILTCWPDDGGPVHHPAAGVQPRPDDRRAQLRHVPHPEARPAHRDHALADS